MESLMSPPGPKFTPLQGQYLAFIATYERLYDQAPAEADLQAYFGVTPPTVHQMILTLERRGLITRVPGAPRSIRLRVAATMLPQLEKRPTRGEQPAPGAVSVPRRRRAKRGPMRNTAPPPDPAGEYIDSTLTTQRLRDGRQLSARINGRYGVYRTRVRLSRQLDGDCTCPSDVQPCKHVRALRATWERNPARAAGSKPVVGTRGAEGEEVRLDEGGGFLAPAGAHQAVTMTSVLVIILWYLDLSS